MIGPYVFATHGADRRQLTIDMLTRIALTLLVLSALVHPTAGSAQVFDGAARDLLRNMQKQPTDLARYVYLAQAMPGLSTRNRQLAAQYLSFSQCELGIYTQAVLSFPLVITPPAGLELPAQQQWRGAPAADSIAALAADRRIVMINEAHHDAHTRQLTLELLPRLRALGFNYFAAEALLPADADLNKRGYPLESSGTEYLREPLYGDIVRTALRLGYHVIAYDTASPGQGREREQARNLYRQTLARDPSARLFVHAGYAHIDKAPGRLDDMQPMGEILQKLSGQQPLSIDQTAFLEVGLDQGDAYHRLAAAFPAAGPQVLLARSDGKPWSAQPKLYDVSVILPPVLSMAAFGVAAEGAAEPRTGNADGSPRPTQVVAAGSFMQRPAWLSLDGQRHPIPISTALCQGVTPCVVEARYANETDDAIAADRYAFLAAPASSTLYLRPGTYSLHAANMFGRTLSNQALQVPRD